MTWWSTYTVSECSNEKKLITERLTLSLQTIYHFVLFIHFLFQIADRAGGITAQLSSPGPIDRCCMESPDESSRCRRAEHRQSRRSRWTRKRWAFRSFGVWVGWRKKFLLLLKWLIALKWSRNEKNRKLLFFFVPFENGIRYWQISMIAMISI